MYWLRWALTVLASLLLLECHEPLYCELPQYKYPEVVCPVRSWEVTAAPNIPHWEYETLLTVAHEWETEAPCATRITVRRGVKDFGTLPERPSKIYAEMGIPPTNRPNTAGWTEWDHANGLGAKIIFRRNDEVHAYHNDFPRVVRHEFGHAFGLSHSGGGAMSDPPIFGAKVTEYDAKLYGAIWCKN